MEQERKPTGVSEDLSLDLVKYDDLGLRDPCIDFDFANPPCDPVKLSHALAQTMIKSGAMSIAAPDVGLEFRVIAIKVNPVLVMFNPKIVHFHHEMQTLDESSPLVPGLIIPVNRSTSVRVRYKYPNGQVITDQFNGLSARIVQHAYECLDGCRFYDHASRLQLDMACRKAKKNGFVYSVGNLRRFIG